MGEANASPAGDKHMDSGVRTAADSVTWSQEVEVCLFQAMLGHKPVGVNRNFHMICIRDKFCQNIGRQVSSKVIWDHLTTMYDMQVLHEFEMLPFPNSEKSFVLPEEIIQDVKEGKLEQEQDMMEDNSEEEGGMCMSHREGSNSSKNATESSGMTGGEGRAREAAEKRKRNRSMKKVLGSSSDPSSPGGTKHLRM